MVDGTIWYEFMILSATLAGMNGVFTLLVYLRPRYVAVQLKRKRQAEAAALKQQQAAAADVVDTQRSEQKLEPTPDESDEEDEIPPELTNKHSDRSARPPHLSQNKDNSSKTGKYIVDTIKNITDTLLQGDAGLSCRGAEEVTTMGTNDVDDGPESES